MDYIDAKQFLEQPKEVQEVFLNWWQPEIGEKIYSTGISFGEYILLDFLGENAVYAVKLDNFARYQVARKVFIPLFTEGQLRKFIEEKTASKIETEYFWRANSIIVSLVQPFDDYLSKNVDYQIDGYDLLQAYWKVACEIAKEVK